MKKVTGIGGLFFKTPNVASLKDWYKKHLGFHTTDWGATMVWGDPDETKETVSRTEWSPFKEDTDYYTPSTLPYMINYRVHDLVALISELKAAGVETVGKLDVFEYGKFAWIMDPEGRKLELWEPVDDKFGDAPQPWNDRVTGLGGVFFKSDDPKKLKAWYKEHLGIDDGMFKWKDLSSPAMKDPGTTVWSPFKADTDYFNPSNKPYMFNYRVKDLKKLIESLKSEGVQIAGDVQEHSYGKFGWIIDPDGTKLELWEPIDDATS